MKFSGCSGAGKRLVGFLIFSTMISDFSAKWRAFLGRLLVSDIRFRHCESVAPFVSFKLLHDLGLSLIRSSELSVPLIRSSRPYVL